MTGRKTTTVAMLALMGAVLASGAMAQGGPGGREGHGPKLIEMFAAIDANSDGKVTPEELDAHRAAMFAAADANGDGVLDAAELAARQEAEMKAMIAERTARMIERRDDNGDGSLSADEMGEGPIEGRFAMIDTDDDGAISEAEAQAAAERFAEHRGKRKHGPMGGWFN